MVGFETGQQKAKACRWTLLGMMFAIACSHVDAFAFDTEFQRRVDATNALLETDPAAALLSFDSLLVEYPLDDERVLSALSALAADRRSNGDDPTWQRDLELCVEMPARKRALWLHARTLDDRAAVAGRTGLLAEADSLYGMTVPLYAEVGDERRHAVSAGSHGVVVFRRSDFRRASEIYAEALEARIAIGDSILIGNSLNALGSCALQTGELDRALEYYRRALGVRQRVGDPISIASTLTYIGHAYRGMRQLEQASQHYSQALDLLPPDVPPFRRAEAANGMAAVLKELGHFDLSLSTYREQLDRLTAVGDTIGASAVHQDIGSVLIQTADYSAALRELHVALSAFQSADEGRVPPVVLNNLGTAYLQLGDLDEALRYYRAAEQSADAIGNRLEQINAASNVALALARKGDLDIALSRQKDVVTMAKQSDDPGQLITALAQAGEMQSAAGRSDEALRSFEDALELARRHEVPDQISRQQINLANALTTTGRFAEARVEFTAAIAACERSGRNDILWTAYLGMADNAERCGELERAAEFNQRATDVLNGWWSRTLSPRSRIELGRKQALAYEAQVHVLAKLFRRTKDRAYSERAFAVAEEGKGKTLRDLLTEPRIVASGNDASLILETEGLEARLRAIDHEIRMATSSAAVREMELRRSQVEGELRQRLERARTGNAELAGLAPGDAVDVGVVQRELVRDERTLLLSYSLGDSASYVWSVVSSDCQMFRLAPRDQIVRAVDDLRNAINRQAPVDEFAASSQALYELILAPLRMDARRWDAIYLVPDGELNSVPFEVLVTPGPAEELLAGTRFADLPYALGDVPLRYAPSATALVMVAGRRAAFNASTRSKDLLAIGAPTFAGLSPGGDVADVRGIGAMVPTGPVELPALPNSRTEVEEIAEFFPPDRRTILVENDARESTICRPGFMDDYRFVHFATHGLVHATNPIRSSLALARPSDDSEDGYVTVDEIHGLDIHAELVVLSACDTGLGRIVRGEGTMGLGRAFLVSGASSVLVSLWNVADKSTPDYMRMFYDAMVVRGYDPARAALVARSELRKDPSFDHPFFWAPFILVGPQ